MFVSLKSSILAGTAGLLSLAAVSLPANAIQEQMPPANAAAISPSVVVFDQKFDGKSVKLDYVYVPKKSFVVVWGSDAKGQPGGEPLGSMTIEPGDHRNINVELTGKAAPGAKLWVSLNDASKSKGAFD